MPIYTFECPNGHRYDELFMGSANSPPDTDECNCGALATRYTAYLTHINGPVFEHLEAINRQLVGERGMRQGKVFKSKRDIERWENERGIYREDDTVDRVKYDEIRHDAWNIKKAAEEGGKQGAMDYVNETETMYDTGWSRQEVREWKEAVDATPIPESYKSSREKAGRPAAGPAGGATD